MVDDPAGNTELDRLLKDWCAEEAKRPGRATPGLLLVKADLARADQRRATATRVERWAFGLAGGLFLAAVVATGCPSSGSGPALVASGGLDLIVLGGAGWCFSLALRV